MVMKEQDVQMLAQMIVADVQETNEYDCADGTALAIIDTIIDCVDDFKARKQIALLCLEHSWPSGTSLGIKRYFDLVY